MAELAFPNISTRWTKPQELNPTPKAAASRPGRDPCWQGWLPSSDPLCLPINTAQCFLWHHRPRAGTDGGVGGVVTALGTIRSSASLRWDKPYPQTLLSGNWAGGTHCRHPEPRAQPPQ